MKTIALDLRNLTETMIDAAQNQNRPCTYASPCIIGAMMTPAERNRLHRAGLDRARISRLIETGAVAVPSNQRVDFINLQGAFDFGDFRRVLADIQARWS